ncbi:MAG: cell envelope integrity protein TolA [Chitinophagia bacterium]|jgi:hypothetical protein
MKKISFYTTNTWEGKINLNTISKLLRNEDINTSEGINPLRLFSIFLLTIFMILSSTIVHCQRKNIPVAQADPRFTVSAERYFSCFAGSEQYYFYVQNNTSDEYRLEIEVTLILACVGTKNFKLGNNYVVYLQPNGQFTPKNDASHIYTFLCDNIKNCRQVDGDSYTLLQNISYRVSNITNITLQKSQEEKKRRDEQAAAERKSAEEKRLREERVASEKKQADETRLAKEKQEAEKKRANTENSSGKNPSENGSATKSSSQSENAAIAKQRSRDDDMARAKAAQEAEAARVKAEQEVKDQRQREYDAWKQKADEQRTQSEVAAATGSIGFLTILGTWIYNDKMGKVDPLLVYNKPRSSNKMKLIPNMAIEWGYSGTSIPILFQSEITTMVGGNYITTKSLKKNPIFTFNLDVTAKFGVENDNFGGYIFLSPKFGFSPLFDGYQASFLNWGTRLFLGVKNIKLYGEYMEGERNFSKSDNDPEESGSGKLAMAYTRNEYGIRFTTNPDANYKRNHISIGMIRERMKLGGSASYLPSEGYIDPSSGNLITYGNSPWINGYTFQWKKDHTFNFYVHYYPEYLIAGNVSYKSPSPGYDLRSSPTADMVEFGFIRSIDFFSK